MPFPQMSRPCLKSSPPSNTHQTCRFPSQIASTFLWRGIAQKSKGSTSLVWRSESLSQRMRSQTPPPRRSCSPWGKSCSWSWISRGTSSSGARSIILTNRGTRTSTLMSPRPKSLPALLASMVNRKWPSSAVPSPFLKIAQGWLAPLNLILLEILELITLSLQRSRR